ncbi:MAG TPA: MFS transporter [Candidatus Binatia bacterium]|nr:MFS transporter [Candidatus Binatia bacterium]
MANEQPKGTSAWSPLQHSFFRALWLASVVSNIGTWMQNVGAAWLMTSLTPSPTLVALVQAVTSLPVFFAALPAGALADVVDRRRLLLWTQGWMLVAAAMLGALTLLGRTSPGALLTLTFALGLGAAMNAPAWQAIIQELVPLRELPVAVALNSVGFNLARAVGPALGGLVVAAAGTGAVFLLNAASFLGVMVVLCRWQPVPRESALPAEHVLGAMQAGMRYVRYAPALQALLMRAGVFILGGSALWALLPLLAQNQLGLDASGYGVLLGCLGVGAVAGAALLPRARQRVSADLLIAGATVLFATVLLTLAFLRQVVLLCAAMSMAGVAWMVLTSTFNVTAQTVVPAWVRARALAVYLLVFNGGMAAGSVLWGVVAARVGTPMALVSAAVGLILGLTVMRRYRLVTAEALDLTPSPHWSDPPIVNIPCSDAGPVLVMVEYRIDPRQARGFAAAMHALRVVRRRDGAIRWGVYGDVADPGRYIETFVVASWAEHLRQHERMTMSDRAVQQRARAFHIGDAPPAVAHLVSAYAMPGPLPESTQLQMFATSQTTDHFPIKSLP